ncbi:hypothetical protein K474DRAFT_1687710 [Panus rudis PR-1116 ss-1]|nr:hypothetical protein K474DRAFT_1687710 [Panus rudis PR-1116 ss-1]
MPVCLGCQRSFRHRADLNNHLAQTKNAACQEIVQQRHEQLPGLDDESDDEEMEGSDSGEGLLEEPELSGLSDNDGDEEPAAFEGDYFGAAEEYAPWDFPGFEPEERLEEPQFVAGPEDDDESEDEYVDPPVTSINAGQKALEEALRQKIKVVPFPSPLAGAPIPNSTNLTTHDRYASLLTDSEQNPYTPFASHMDWAVARWAKLRGPGSTAVSELLSIPGDALGLSYKNSRELNQIIDTYLPAQRPCFHRGGSVLEGEIYDVYYRDILACIRALYGDPSFAPYLIFKPEKHFADHDEKNRIYHDMHTGKWWWETQIEVEKQASGATIIPIILSSDKTQITDLGGKMAYPVYLTIGNIPKEIRRKPSRQAHILLAYLPTAKLENITNQAARRRMIANIFHSCLRRILNPTRKPGHHGMPMSSGDGISRRCHTIMAAHCGDYLEHLAVVGCKMHECVSCTAQKSQLGIYPSSCPLRDYATITAALKTFDTDPLKFNKNCKSAGIKPIIKPYWLDLPFCNIFRQIPPDILHQLHQGLVKHLVSWICSAYSPEEIDARCRRLPPNHHIRHFSKGITSLSRLTGREHNQIARILIGLIIDMPLPNGASSSPLIKAARGLLDFVYLAQYPVQTTTTLQYLRDALKRFHDNKDIFVELKIRSDFNFFKLHFADHWELLIEWLGTPDNFNTEYSERLHIDLAKDAYEATNHKDEFTQMTIWVERQEKIMQHDSFIQWNLDGRPQIQPASLYPPLPSRLIMTKNPSYKSVKISTIESTSGSGYGARYFRDALARFVVKHNYPHYNHRNVEKVAANVHFPTQNFPIYHKAKFWLGDANHHRLMADEFDVLHAAPARKSRRDTDIPARFDTAMVYLEHDDFPYIGVQDYRVAQIRVIFELPSKILAMFRGTPPPQYLAYVEWFTDFPSNPHPDHGLYRIKRMIQNGARMSSIIPLGNIRRSVHLFPRFGAVAPASWTHHNVLEECTTFYVNAFSDRHAFYTIV